MSCEIKYKTNIYLYQMEIQYSDLNQFLLNLTPLLQMNAGDLIEWHVDPFSIKVINHELVHEIISVGVDKYGGMFLYSFRPP